MIGVYAGWGYGWVGLCVMACIMGGLSVGWVGLLYG